MDPDSSQLRYRCLVADEKVAPQSWQLLKLRVAAALRYPLNFAKQARYYRNRELSVRKRSPLSESRQNSIGRFSPKDYSVVVPLSYESQISIPKYAVLLHIYNATLASEFRGYLENLDCEFDLFISTTRNEARAAITQVFAGFPRGAVEVRVFENRGRDIAPKLVGFRDVYDRYEFVLHIHGKESRHLPELKYWRQYLLETLSVQRT